MAHKHLEIVVFVLLYSQYGLALQCHDSENGTCDTEADGSCVTLYLKGSVSSSSVSPIKLNRQLCDKRDCNTTRLCKETAKLFSLKRLNECYVACCKTSMCNGGPLPTKSVLANPVQSSTPIKPRLRCYKCNPGIGANACAKQPSVVECQEGENVCYSAIGKAYSEDSKDRTNWLAIRGCGTSSVHCNKTARCVQAVKQINTATGSPVKECTGYCCSGELCNRFNPTRSATFARRTGSKDYDVRLRTPITEKVRPVKCYECTPENLGSLCHSKIRRKSCPRDGRGEDIDGCFTMSVAIINTTSGKVVDRGEWKGCSVTTADCHVNSSRCDKLSGGLKDRGLSLQDCYVNCCHGDMCNNFAPTPGPAVEARSTGQRSSAASESWLLAVVSLTSVVFASGIGRADLRMLK